MKKEDLGSLKTDMETALAEGGFVVFRGHSRMADPDELIHWDDERYPDFRMFLDAARAVGVRLVVFHHREFTADVVTEASDRLENAELPRDEKRSLERRLRELHVFDGFTCALEMSFDFSGRTYIYEVNTEWYDDLLDILDDIEAALPEEDEDEGPIGGYFSRN